MTIKFYWMLLKKINRIFAVFFLFPRTKGFRKKFCYLKDDALYPDFKRTKKNKLFRRKMKILFV